MKQHNTIDLVMKMQFAQFGKALSNVFPTCQGKEFEVGDIIAPMLQNFQKICETIKDIDIPAIIIEGPDDQLALLFERINSKGTQLSKYQIYAASWVGDSYKIDDDLIELVKANRDHYDSMVNGKLEIDDYDSAEFLNKRSLNTFEIAFGLGKFLCDKYPYLFGMANDENTVDSVGFNLINACLGQKNKDTINMNVKLKEYVNDSVNLFLHRVLECVKDVDKRVGKYNKFKSNSRDTSGKRPLHSEFQICAIVASVFLMKYADIIYSEDDRITSFSLHLDKQNEEWKKTYERLFENNAAKNYIAEILQHKWSNAGDRKIDQIIITPHLYTRKIDAKEFEDIMDNWYNSLNNERVELGKVATPKEPEQLMLAVVYLMNNFSAKLQLDSSKFDIEHLATKQLMKDRLANYNGELRLPISSFGNLCLLPEYENRSKGKKTIYHDTEYLKESKLTIQQVERDYSFTEEGDLDWIEIKTLSAKEFSENYYSFINKRYKKMKGIIISNYEKLS